MNLFELFIKIGVDDQASDKVSNLSNKLGNGLKTAAKIGVAAVGAASAGIVALTKSAVDNFSEYEQLVGGVETLFKQSADVVQQYAANAYKTAGMSANEYMDTVTSFSASLLQSLGGDTAAAAEKANLAITDMSDNANKLGTSMEMIQNAYQGFSKQNYTMLDNLKLGYGGTKEEMQRLLEDAEKISGIKYDISSYADIVDAIHVVQTEMGITGTTAEEAASTISGSIQSAKSAWTNLLVGIADENADMSLLVTNFVDSAMTAAGNIVPRIGVILSSLGQLIIDYVPVMADYASNMILSFTDSLTSGDSMSKVVESGINILTTLITAILNMIPVLIEAAPEIIKAFVLALWDNRGLIAQSGMDIMQALGEGIVTFNKFIIDTVKNYVVDPISNKIKELPRMALQWGKDLIDNFVSGIKSKISAVTSAVSGIASTVKSFLGFSEPEEGPLSNFHTYAPDMMKLFAQGIKDNEKVVTDQIAKSFNFETATVGFESSGVGMSSAGIVNGINSGRSSGATIPSRIELVMKSEDGQMFGRWMVPFIRSEDKSNPEVVSDAV